MRRTVAALAVAALAALVGLAGCGQDDPEPVPVEPATPAATATGGIGQTPTPDPTETAGPDAVFEFAITDGRAEPPLDRHTVAQGSTVRIEVTSDQADELHLHGYDLDADVSPGEPAVIEFTADQTGLFELEAHESALVLLQLQVE